MNEVGDGISKKGIVRRGFGCVGIVLVVVVVILVLIYGVGQLRRNMLFWGLDEKYEYAMQQCERYGGLRGQVPVNTEGVFDHRGVRRKHNILNRAAVFINSGLSYVEFDKEVINLSTSTRRYKRGDPQFRKGSQLYDYYRAYVSEKSDPFCGPYQKFIQQGNTAFESADLKDSQCVAIVGFDDPKLLQSPYELVVTDKIINEGVPVEWSNVEIIDRTTQSVVASYNTFSHCFTEMKTHASEGFGYCDGIYRNPKVRPKCPKAYAENARAIVHFEMEAFTYQRER